MSIDLAVLVVSNILNLILGLVVIARNPSGWHNRLFALFAISVIGWTTFNYLADNALNGNLLFTRLTFLSSVLLIYFMVAISRSFPNRYLVKTTSVGKIYAFMSGLMALIVLTPWFIEKVIKVDHGVELTLSHLYVLFLAFVVISIFIIVYNFVRQYKAALDSARRDQIRLILIGTVLYAFFAVAFSVVLPAIYDSWSSSRFAPLFTVFFVSMTGYAIVRHGLFDVRFVVARSLVYILSVVSLALIYGVTSFNIINAILPDDASLSLQRFTYTLMAVVLAFSFQPLRRFFNRWTNRFFYQDAYDPQTLLSNLNNVLVSTMDLNKMLKAGSEVISADIKPEYCAFGLRETDTKRQRIIGDMPNKPSTADIQLARLHTPKFDHKVILADILDDADKELQAGMRANNVAVLVRLTNDVDAEGVGYIILGPKKSGNSYNSQDVKVLETIANSMIIAIENAIRFEEIQNFNTHLEEEIKQATGKLQRANDKLIALDQTKDDFISMASHQLRTPLTSVKGYVSMVLEGDAGKINDDQRELLGQAFISSQRMVYLIADLLNLSRLKTGKFVIEATPLNLAEVVDSEIAQVKETATARGLKLVYNKPKDFPVLMVDETKIRQVMTNFIDNAIYYTPKGGQIDIILKDGRQSVEFTVTDNGIGVPRSEQHNLFNKFFRAGNAKKARPDGTGLGLFMAKKVIVAQGGAIVFKSAEGKGSTFGFTFLKSRLKVK